MQQACPFCGHTVAPRTDANGLLVCGLCNNTGKASQWSVPAAQPAWAAPPAAQAPGWDAPPSWTENVPAQVPAALAKRSNHAMQWGLIGLVLSFLPLFALVSAWSPGITVLWGLVSGCVATVMGTKAKRELRQLGLLDSKSASQAGIGIATGIAAIAVSVLLFVLVLMATTATLANGQA